MAQSVAITLNENNDEDVNVAITTNVPTAGTVLNLTGMSVSAVLKKTAMTADSDPTSWNGSTTTSGVTITNASGGLVTVSFPASAVTPAMGWWRVDVIDASSKIKSAVYGQVTVVDM